MRPQGGEDLLPVFDDRQFLRDSSNFRKTHSDDVPDAGRGRAIARHPPGRVDGKPPVFETVDGRAGGYRV